MMTQGGITKQKEQRKFLNPAELSHNATEKYK